MAVENPSESQPMPARMDAPANVFNPNTSADSTSLHPMPAAPSHDHLDVAHDNLATLAAVSAAGAEALPNPTPSEPPTTQSTLDNSLSSLEPTSTTATPKKTATPAVQPPAPVAPPQPTQQQQQQPQPPIDEEDAKWHSVGIYQGLSTTVTSYINNSVWSSSGRSLNSDEIPDLSQYERINLEPGTAYRFRIRALNAVGASDWSEISSFKTCLPGFPGAPSAIKISKSSEGAHLTWEPPPSCVSSNEIVEYSVYLAVKPGKDKETKAGQRAPAQLAFVRVYVGAANQCTVSHNSLSAAHVDCSNKPAIIFRIAARNEKGYGPATQVRWLQDPVQNSAANPSLGPNSLLSPSRVKAEMVGASPNKRFKASTGR